MSPKDVPPMWRTKNPASSMCLGVVGSDGRQMPLHWFEKKPDRRGVDQDQYMEASPKLNAT